MHAVSLPASECARGPGIGGLALPYRKVELKLGLSLLQHLDLVVEPVEILVGVGMVLLVLERRRVLGEMVVFRLLGLARRVIRLGQEAGRA